MNRELAAKAVAVLVVSSFAVALGLVAWRSRPTPAPARETTVSAALSKTHAKRRARAKPAPAVSGAPVRDHAAELSRRMVAESAKSPFSTGPLAGKGIYELLALWGEDVDDATLQDSLKTGMAWTDSHTQAQNDAQTKLMDDGYADWSADVWRTANDHIHETSDGLHDGLPGQYAVCPALRDLYGSYPAGGSDEASFGAIADWMGRVDSAQAACDGGR